VRQRLVGRDPGKACDLGGLDLEHVVNFAGDVAEPTLAAFEALFGPRRLLTRCAHRFERPALRAVSLSEHALALRELIGRGAARSSASRARFPSMSPRAAASCVSMLAAGGNTVSARCASLRPAIASSRLALSRVLASPSAERRAALRPAWRSASACRSRAV